MTDSGEVNDTTKSDKKDWSTLTLQQKVEELENAHLQKIKKPWVIPVPKGTLQRIFGTSRVFYNFEDVNTKIARTLVPLKIKEYYQRGHQCLEEENWEMALLFFSRALHLDPKMTDCYIFRAEAYLQLCDFSSAVQNLRMACAFEPDNTKYLNRLAFVLYLQGQCLLDQCDFQEALNIFLQVSELQPQNAYYRYRCMACLLALGRHQECLSLITREVRHGTATPDIYILRARIYNFFQKPKLCYQDLRSALLLDPKHPQAKGLLQIMVDQAQQDRQDASILAVQGKLQRALKRINCAIDNNPLDPSFFLFRGTLYRRLQEFDQAVEDLLKALDMVMDIEDPLVSQTQRQLLLAYNDFAVHCYTHGAYQEGILLLNKAIRDEQHEKGLYINRGDCFFQLGNLAFAEADYKQALALSPQDEGANMRMGILQEKMGFCEKKHRQFQKAEDHFSVAIKHNPQKAQYYMHRAKNRQLLQDIFGARQDVATVLLLNPKQPKMLPLISNLFPGMSVEEVLGSHMAHLARLQLKQLEESSQPASHSEGIVGILRRRELERQKARALQLSWKQLGPEIPQKQIPHGMKEDWEEEAEAPTVEETEKRKFKGKLIPHRMTAQSDSYLDQTSLGSVFSSRTFDMSESETSIYKSTSTIAETFSDSSLKKPQPSTSGNKETLGLNRGLRKGETSQDLSQPIDKTADAHDQKRMSINSEATQGPKPKPSKTKAAQSPRKKLQRAKAERAHRRRSSKASTLQGHSQGLMYSSSKVKAFHDQDGTNSSAHSTQGQSPRHAKVKDAQSQSSKGSSQNSKRPQASHTPSQDAAP